jgi:acyl-CoA thioesterase-1
MGDPGPEILMTHPFRLHAILSSCAALALLANLASAQPSGKPLKWACIGNSITQGDSPAAAYPAKLGKLLGPGFAVENDGVSGTTLLKAGDSPYWKQGKLGNVFSLKPDIITIKLGTNDSKPVNWDAHKGEFEKDYLALIDTLAAMPQKPRIFLCLPVSAFSDAAGSGGIRGSVIKNEIIPLIKKIGDARGLPVIDLYTPMVSHAILFPDGVHPNPEGQDSIAAMIYRFYLSQSTRLACIGNSITQYTAQANTDPKDAYPVKLNEMLGANWFAINQGWSGAYMQKASPQPYWNSTRLKDVINYKPNVVTIKLGTNDSRQQDWHADKFIADYESMIDSLNTMNPKPKIWLLTPIPSWMVGGAWPYNGINDSIIKNQTLPALKQVAKDKGLDVIDLYTPMSALKRLVPDGVHPIAEGQDSLAHFIYRAISTAPTSAKSFSARPYAWPEIDLRHGLLRVALPGAAEGRARLFSADGRELSAVSLQGGNYATLPLSGLPSGRYFLSIAGPAGQLAVKAFSL